MDFLDSPEVLEALAAVEHERWAHWQSYLHNQCSRQPDGSLLMPAHLVQRWQRQIETPYAKLSEEERASDREQAIEYLSALRTSVDRLRDGSSESPQ
ncbi:hypothetical protein [Brachybacterium sp. UNK5269]|uniref:hypothetical protein n=1 Tax=Brachybacterium sp. UNK5269 TaxID=3408576 RepID=UPI003BAEAF60